MMNPSTKITPRPSRRNVDYWLKIYLFAAIIGALGGGVAILLRISIEGIQYFFIDILLNYVFNFSIFYNELKNILLIFIF